MEHAYQAIGHGNHDCAICHASHDACLGSNDPFLIAQDSPRKVWWKCPNHKHNVSYQMSVADFVGAEKANQPTCPVCKR